MNLNDQERDRAKEQALIVTQKIYEELEKRFQENDLKNIPTKVLMEQFHAMMNLLKQQMPKIALSIPVSFDPERAKRIEKYYEAKTSAR